MKFSFILCTLNRKDQLRSAVKSLCCQTYGDFEIIIVDQSDEIDNDISNYDDRIHYYHSKKKGLSFNRNFAITKSIGDYICLMDDDATYLPNTLEEYYRAIEMRKTDILCGKMIDPMSGSISLKGMKDKDTSITYSNIMEYCSSPALVIKRDAAISGFDDKFGVGARWGCGEEVDLVLREMYKGKKIEYLSKAVVCHPAVDKEKISEKKVVAYSLGYGALCAKHYLEYNNTYMKNYYYKALIKHTFAWFLSLLHLDKNMMRYYAQNIRYKVRGYEEYKLFRTGHSD